MQPDRMEWPLGQDFHSRRVRLIRTTEAGQVRYRLHREEANQRDEAANLHDLPLAVLQAIGEVAAAEAKGR